MSVTHSLLSALFGVIIIAPVLAGEIVLYGNSNCKSNPTVFAADATTGCRQFEQGILGPELYAASTSRNIGSSCAFQLYSDTNCKTLAANVTSSGPLKSCLPITKGLVSYKISCAKPVNANLDRPRRESDLVLNSYLQPPVTYRGKPSGNITFAGYNDFIGSTVAKKPTGNPSAVGPKLASAFFSQVPPDVHQFTASATDGGTLYQVTLIGYTANNYTAQTAAAKMGVTAFASLMADTATQLAQKPCNYYFYGLSNYDHLDEELGQINITYVAA